MKHRKGIFILIIFFFSSGLYAQEVSFSELFWSPCTNRALLAGTSTTSLSGNLENSFLIPQISKASLFFSKPAFNSNVYLSASRFGYHHFNETSFTAGISKVLTNSISISSGLGISGTRVPENAYSEFILQAELGLLCRMNEKLKVSVAARDISREGERTINMHHVSFIIQYTTAPGVTITGGLSKATETRTPSFFTQFVYHLNRSFVFVSMNTAPVQYSLGYAWRKRSMTYLLGMKYHNQLGPSPAFAAQWEN